MNGLLNLYKPKGPTSFSLCYKIRKILRSHQLTDSSTHKLIKVGHTGTLDPLAEGVLVLCLGKATKIIPFLKDEKEYVAQIRLGQRTETDDAEGVIISESPIPSLNEENVKNILKEYEGEIDQTPPLYSAVRIKGKRSYQLARKSHRLTNSSTHQLDLPKPKKVNILEIELLNWENPDLAIRAICSSGTYIRSLARDIGEQLGCGGHLASLKRTRVGIFKIEHSLHLSELNSSTHQLIDSSLISVNSALDHLPEIVVPESLRESVLHGNSFPIHTPHVIASPALSEAMQSQKESDYHRILTESAELLAIGKKKGDEIHPLRVLV
jgi:tRNA pseudouridine55 synthase